MLKPTVQGEGQKPPANPVKSDDPAALLKASQEQEKPSVEAPSVPAGKDIKESSGEPIQNKIDVQLKQAAQAVPREEKEAGKDFAVFISLYPNLCVHIPVAGKKETDKNGNDVNISIPIQFKNGFYRTENPAIIEGLRIAAAKHSQSFREETNMQQAAVMYEGHKARANNGNVSGGIATSNDGDLGQMSAAELHLRKMHETVYNGGGLDRLNV